LCRYRVQRAATDYAFSSLSIAEIAEAVGFSDYCYFSKSFKKYIGKSPAEYLGKWKKKQLK
ncbi:MAG: helix-turn-helix domain-containing protein, partial [Clostridia bacterium]|nr:helix-turn-helix domain-containing protein [Clostridia bacterium]